MSKKLTVVRRGQPLKPSQKRQVAQIAKKAVRKEAETKEKDLTYTALGLSSIGYGSASSVLYMANQIASGSADGQRVGNKILIQNIRFQFAIMPGDTTNWFRLIFVIPKTGVDYNATVTNVAENVLGLASSATQWMGLIDTDRYRVLYDKMIFLEYVPDAGSSAAVHGQGKILKGNIKLNKEIEYAYSSASAATYATNDVLMLAISDSGAVSHPGAVAGNLRIYYKDV